MKTEVWEKRIHRFSDGGWLQVEKVGSYESYELAFRAPFMSNGHEQLHVYHLSKAQYEDLRTAIFKEGGKLIGR